LYRGAWIYRVDQFYFQGGNKFDWRLIWHLTRSHSEEYWFPFYRPKKGEVIVDVGAGRGEDLPAFLDAVGTTGRATAIEAHPISFHAALMNEPGSVAITDLEEWVSNEIKQQNDPNAKERTSCAAIDLQCSELPCSERKCLVEHSITMRMVAEYIVDPDSLLDSNQLVDAVLAQLDRWAS
jgi:hypothetical protein